MSEPLAIVGASVRAAASSAARAGYRPLAADLFADADLRRIATATRIAPYPEGLLDWLRAVEPPAWMYTGALENQPELIDQMAWIAPLWGNAGDVLARIRAPGELAGALREAGLLFPETRDSAEELPRDGSWLAKTYRGAGGSGVCGWDEQAAVGSSEPRCFQRRIAGLPCSAAFVAADGAARLLGVTRQLVGETWLGAGGFQYAGSIGPLDVGGAAHSSIARLGNVLAKRFALCGLFGVDFVLDGQRVWTLEVNPRYTASVEIIERATGIQAMQLHADACCAAEDNGSASLPPAPGTAPGLHGKAIVFARRDIVIAEPLATAALAEALLAPWPQLADVPAAGTTIEAGRPILTVFADGASAEEVERRLRARVANIEGKLYLV